MNRMIAEHALLPGGWHENVLLEWNANGCFTRVEPGQGTAPARSGIVVPGMPNLHSHAFQRAMAGLAEYRTEPLDSFWSWRALMYEFVRKISPPALHAIARQLYIEMLKAGYTSVCEFHYLHHDVGGKPYANPAEQAECLIAAAAEAGIGLTLLPVLYQYGGFGCQPPCPEQARFVNSPQWVFDLLQRLAHSHPQHAGLRYGVAPHSLRAVSPAGLRELLADLKRWDARAPVHLHIAEQMREVEDAVAHLGARPVDWLLDSFDVDGRWCLVHATHMSEAETRALARSGAAAAICPSTEANLGDGIFNGAAYAAAGGTWGIGSDSHVSISVREELRLFEYSQRLLHRRRNVLADGAGGSVGGYLYREVLRGGAAASGRPVAGLQAGQRADLVVLDRAHPDLWGRTGDQWLDAFIFCNHASAPISAVMAGGRWLVEQGHHPREEASLAAYRDALDKLLAA